MNTTIPNIAFIVLGLLLTSILFVVGVIIDTQNDECSCKHEPNHDIEIEQAFQLAKIIQKIQLLTANNNDLINSKLNYQDNESAFSEGFDEAFG